MKRTLYDVLEVSPKASPETIRAAYKSLLQRYHPDKNGSDPRRAALAREMIEAYQVLSDTKARVAYDWELRAQRRPSRPAPPPAPPPPKPAAAPPAAAPRPAPIARRWRPALAWGACISLLLFLLGFLLLPLFDPGPQPPAQGRTAAVVDSDPPPADGASAPAAGAPGLATGRAAQGLRAWLIAYRSLDPYARAAEVRRLVNNGTLPLVRGEGKFFGDPKALRESNPALIEAPNALSREDAAALEELQSWWLAPQQLNILVLNDLQPERALGGFIFELAQGSCAAANAVGAVAIDLGRRSLQAGEGALVQISVPDLPRELYAARSCGTVVSGNYGSAEVAPGR